VHALRWRYQRPIRRPAGSSGLALERRAFEHKEGKPGSFAARYHANRLVYFEEFAHIDEAIAREKEIKKMTRRRKAGLIESMNPEWKDLSEE
jgi:putative endonuclease